ncbi:MAG: serine/threonine protein kinase [Azospirillum sp.]|nr:serine/threonine protein kinase [Azospirillum sp.]
MTSDQLNFGQPKKAPTTEPVRIDDRVEILLDAALPTLDSAAGTAYAARNLRGRKEAVYALVCSGRVPSRMESPTAYSTIDNAALVCLHEWAVIDWPADGARRLVFIFDRPPARRLMNHLTSSLDPVGEEQLGRLIVQPALSLLKDLAGRGLSHGGIRPTNVFVDDHGAGLVLGECVSTLPGLEQPALFEPIERALAQPSGRGPATIADDLYALGVTTVIALLGHNPVAAVPEDKMLDAKIENGSYAAVVGSARLPLSVAELVRGLLIDDPKQRWGLPQVELWLSGRRLSPKQAQLPRRAPRGFPFGGGEHWFCRAVARALMLNPTAAAQTIESGELDRWLRRSLGDEARADAVASASRGSHDGGRAASLPDRVVARVAICLDPPAPIRYKDKAVLPTGLGGALAEAFLRGDSGQVVAEMIAAQLPVFWLSNQIESRPEFVPLLQVFDTLRVHLERVGPGYGIERVLYELNPTLPCLSPQVIDHHALSPPDLLTALDAVAKTRDRSKEPMDRHIAAFLAVRHRRIDDKLLSQLGTGVDPTRRCIAILTILTDVQARFGHAPLPHLCAWVAGLLTPALDRFHNRTQREKLRKDVDAAGKDGRLVDILRAVDDPAAIRQDQIGFQAARRSHKRIVTEVDKLRRLVSNPTAIAETTGRQVAAIISGVVASFLLTGTVLLFVTR